MLFRRGAAGNRRPEARVRTSSSRRFAPFVSVAIVLASSGEAAAQQAEALRWDRPVRCMLGPNDEPVRVQCEGARGRERCLVAANRTRTGGELNRVGDCSASEADSRSYAELVASGATMVPASAETPPGFERSEEGRAYQVKFDLRNRVYVGASWTPTFEREDARLPSSSSPGESPFGLGRARVEAGIEVSALSPTGRSRHDLRILDGTAALRDLELRGVLVAYDYQHLHRRPGLWVTTFIGPPAVHELTPPLGWGFRILDVSDRPPAFRDRLDVELNELHLSWSPLQSADLYDRLRVEAGADFGGYWEHRTALGQGLDTGTPYVGLTSAVRSRVSLGEGGLHSIAMDLSYRRPTLLGGERSGAVINRFEANVAYEGVLLALNDQPLSLRLAGMGGARDDPAVGARSVEVGFSVGLRFSLWAPPRVFQPLPELEDP